MNPELFGVPRSTFAALYAGAFDRTEKKLTNAPVAAKRRRNDAHIWPRVAYPRIGIRKCCRNRRAPPAKGATGIGRHN